MGRAIGNGSNIAILWSMSDTFLSGWVWSFMCFLLFRLSIRFPLYCWLGVRLTMHTIQHGSHIATKKLQWLKKRLCWYKHEACQVKREDCKQKVCQDETRMYRRKWKHDWIGGLELFRKKWTNMRTLFHFKMKTQTQTTTHSPCHPTEWQHPPHFSMIPPL